MLKACSRCGRVHSYNYDCKHGIRRKYEATDENKLRSLNAWKVKRERIKERSLNLCAICKQRGDFSPKALEVHHITKLREYPDGLLEDDNLICLCVAHHKQADKGEFTKDYLKQLAKERDSRQDALL